jgi:Protein of unknown function (DUF4238)
MSESPDPQLPPEIAAILKLSGQKAKQHYVFRRYLKPWCTNQQIALLRDGVAKMVGVADVAVQKYFYRLQQLTEEDVTLVRNTLLAPANDFVRNLAESLIQCFTLPHTVQNLIESTPALHPQVSQWIQEQIVNGEEDYHCMIEHGLIPALDDMLEGNTSFYFDPKTCYEFLYAVCVQYFRTKKMRAAIGAVNSPLPGSDMNRVRNLFTLISAMRVADSLFQERTEHKIVILKNETAVPFVTGDQPIINLHATRGQGIPQELEFYYPLSPVRAMTLIRVGTDVAESADENRVNTLNELIVKNSHEQVFSNSVGQLEAIAASA